MLCSLNYSSCWSLFWRKKNINIICTSYIHVVLFMHNTIDSKIYWRPLNRDVTCLKLLDYKFLLQDVTNIGFLDSTYSMIVVFLLLWEKNTLVNASEVDLLDSKNGDFNLLFFLLFTNFFILSDYQRTVAFRPHRSNAMLGYCNKIDSPWIFWSQIYNFFRNSNRCLLYVLP